ncbi:hypothetical protein GO491_03070 [Flavobacteriaceae bacterium Ap0902]|nr:hypothetical protein [Flavobacteriaceae bacterium Ap0902]
MNRLNVQQTGGFPLTTNTLDFMQTSLLLMQEFGNIAGNLTIIRGCEVRGTQVSSGAVFINGEILEFAGGTLGSKVIIQETRTQKQFEDGSAKDVEIKRIARFGNGLKAYSWDDFTRITPIKILQKSLTPAGLISMWSGSLESIPEGWVLCNGQNGTPDLSGKFIRGYSEEEYRQDQGAGIGSTGGKDNLTLEEVNMPPHKHTGTTSSAGAHSHPVRDGIGGSGTNSILGGDGRSPNFAGSDRSANWVQHGELMQSSGAHAHSLNISKAGGLNGQAKPFDNRPAFYTLAFIMFKG